MKTETVQFELSAGLASQLPAAELPEIVFSGRSNVGKSSLLNRLIQRKSLARVSTKPGKTATINFYRLDTCRLVDLPGYGYARVSKPEKLRWAELVEGYFAGGRPIALLMQIIDMRHEPSNEDEQMLTFLLAQKIPFLVVATKSDKLNATDRRQRSAALDARFTESGVEWIPFSAQNGENVDLLRDRIDSVCAKF